MGYKDENLKHRQGISAEPKYRCPECDNPLSLNKIPFLVICGKCKKTIKGDDIVINS